MSQIASNEVFDLAFDWLCCQRRHTGPNNDVWDLRWNWPNIKPWLQEQLLDGKYRLGPTRRVWLDSESGFVEVWSARDTLVLKAVAIVLSREWNSALSDRCFHIAGRGGAKAAVRWPDARAKSA